MGSITVKTVAEAVGVSPSTVSNAYNRPDQLSAELRERILATAAELGYAGPDAAGRSLRSGRAGAVGVLLTERLSYAFSDPYATGFLAGLAEVVEQARTSIVLMPLADDPDADGADLTAVRQANIDAITLICIDHEHPAAQLARARGIRIVATDVPTTDVGAPAWVAIDDVEAGALVGRHLAALGHTRAAVIADTGRPAGTVSGPLRPEDITCVDCAARIRGLTATLPDGVTIVSGGHNAVASGSAATALLLDDGDAPTAIVGLSDVVAYGVLQTLRERGMRVPEDVSVCGFDDVPEAAEWGLTTVRQPIVEKGRAVGRLLLNADDPEQHVLLPIELVVRSTTAPPR